jgi:hypothetical protein
MVHWVRDWPKETEIHSLRFRVDGRERCLSAAIGGARGAGRVAVREARGGEDEGAKVEAC